ncbi:hypothetical protein AgCh_018411 [Apium graveolens]
MEIEKEAEATKGRPREKRQELIPQVPQRSAVTIFFSNCAPDNSDLLFSVHYITDSEILSSCSSSVKHSTGIHQENDVKEEEGGGENWVFQTFWVFGTYSFQNVDQTRKIVKHKKRTYAPDRLEAIKQEVEKLLEVGFIEEVQFPELLANPVMVKKANGKWRMCIDFTDLNYSCPKDYYPLPRIDTLIDATA